MERRVVIMFFM